MKVLEVLKEKVARLKHEMTAIYYAYRHPSVGWLLKIIIIVCLAYALSPIDLIPDFIPIIGYLDDLLILPLLLGLAIALIPKAVMVEARARAEVEPIHLKDNWVVAGLFILLWVGLGLLVVRAILKAR
ncbi:MAG: hypothetical protein A2087_13275 [Spirochaetes bacterium GWD1_61_31]|nr:MAG: hypothetical protein A2Y37_02680 [Spirochaetes bacterium GWB1_60_80]OHD31280.1 MAG: hypothetical protein A2004_13555 [Spirochaetes bacterium GWC1_61_12]OHD39464.1 MAG: hypothetical protein A2087_13275 [Spirochaetes bacterium GWD1_61_31]OHD45516.1 MAG: hypothetical protein A2Y35_02950 [Spirochaetes bacterium GWE1_60_18]OHD58089.1 MAG: hypothetical protein A2Y32_05525 [Spirochaetes bacterium GWF1_60_12]HAP44660.1 hypothetical protein [Spirochaetaceae bacterium]